ncbi:MAG: NAD(P)H-hydrate dehydratase [Planctomycetaceae bacterium]|nr:NAD(P)H-hydrate dehydratase [Planctomycetaceae bacterium]
MRRITQLPLLPARPADAHKGTFGRVLVVAGSRGMSGAAVLAGTAALRGGAGLVFVAAPCGVVPVIAGYEPSYLTMPLAEDAEGRIDASSLEELSAQIAGMDAVAIGPGLGQSEGLASVVSHLYASVAIPMIVDADGLNLLAREPRQLVRHGGPRILTPHPGEFARLTGVSVGSSREEREQAAAHLAQEHSVTVVLKGTGTIITDGTQIAVNTTGNSGMATGGTGDVLTGLMASLLAQGMDTFAAAQLGVHVHGLAGDLVAVRTSQRGLIASDLLKGLCDAWIELEANASEMLTVGEP